MPTVLVTGSSRGIGSAIADALRARGARVIGHATYAWDAETIAARIATEIDQAYDTFYVTDRLAGRVEDPAASTRLKEALEDALMKPL